MDLFSIRITLGVSTLFLCLKLLIESISGCEIFSFTRRIVRIRVSTRNHAQGIGKSNLPSRNKGSTESYLQDCEFYEAQPLDNRPGGT